jgi:hypothetical protein
LHRSAGSRHLSVTVGVEIPVPGVFEAAFGDGRPEPASASIETVEVNLYACGARAEACGLVPRSSLRCV